MKNEKIYYLYWKSSSDEMHDRLMLRFVEYTSEKQSLDGNII